VVTATADQPQALRARLAWITGLRLLFLVVLFAAMVVFYLRSSLFTYAESQRIMLTTIGAGFGLAAVYAAVLRTGKNLNALAYAQLTLDQVTWTAIVYVTGGATSGATSLYALTAVLGAVLIGMRGALYAAAVGLVAYASFCAALVLQILLPPRDQIGITFYVTADRLLFPFLVNALGIVVVATLSGYLAARLRTARGDLVVATQRAEEAEQLALLGRLAAGLAHEIRNPLGSISGSIEMLKESPDLSDEDKLLCDIIQREAARLNQLVGDMVHLSKPREPALDDVDLVVLAKEVVALAARTERSGAGDVHVEYNGPDVAPRVRCDGGQIKQVLWNLVRNAVQASAAGTRVVVEVDPREDHVALSVADQGPGIPDSAREKIFDAFYTTRTKGTGLGLAVVKRIMDAHEPHGASIAVTSPSEGGARFELVLPKVKESAKPAAAETALPAPKPA
jgi:signal transduction histidine kinase